MLLQKEITEKSWSNVYAQILKYMHETIQLDYKEYLSNLFVDMKKAKKGNLDQKDYNKFCKQIAEKDKFIGLFFFIGELFKMSLLESVLIKKYIMILYNNIAKTDFKNEMEIETSAHCIKAILNICNERRFYDLVISKFVKMTSEDRKSVV